MRHEGDPGHSQARDGVAFVRLRRRVLRSWEGSAIARGLGGLARARVGRGRERLVRVATDVAENGPWMT